MTWTNTTLMDVSSAIANYSRPELVLALTISGWIGVSWATRRRLSNK